MSPVAMSAGRSAGAAPSWLTAMGGTIVSVSFFIFVPALKPFAFGVWYQSEPVVAALFACAAAATLCLALMAALRYPVTAALTHPLTLATSALALWSAAASLAAPLPVRSAMGPPQTGEGVLWYASLAVLTALTLALWQRRRVRQAIVGSAAVSGIILLVLNVSEPIGSPWRPVVWPEFAALLGLSMMAIVASDKSLRWPAPLGRRLGRAGRTAPGPGALRAAAALALGGAIVVTSQNKTAIGIAAAVIPAMLLLAWATGTGRSWRLLAAGAALGLALAVPAGMYWLGTAKGLESPLSRTEMILVALEAFRSDPMLLVHGAGWGSFNDVLYRFLDRVRDVRAVTETWQQSLGNTGGGAFHTHNTYLEATLAAGLPAGLLMAALPVTAILCARRRSRALLCAVWVAVAGLLAAWFTLPVAVPFQAVAFAATAGGIRRRRAPAGATASRPLAAVVALIVAVTLAAGSALSFRVAADSERLLSVIRSGRPPASDMPPFLLWDHGQGGSHLWWIALDLTHGLAAKGQNGQPLTDGEAFWFETLLRAVDRHVADLPSSTRLKSLTLIMRDELATKMGDPRLDRLREWEVPAWSQKLFALLDQLPGRIDLAVPFLDLLVTSDNGPVAIRVGNELLLRNPDDPVALWFTGIAMAPTAEWGNLGQARLLRAVDTGVERVIPLTPEIRNRLHELRPD